MVIQEMTPPECRAMLARINIGRLACAHQNQPYIVPIHIDLHGEFLYSFATLGQKVEWMRQNPLVCLEIEELITQSQWASVVVFGRYEELPPVPEYLGERNLAEDLFQKHASWWEPASVPVGTHDMRAPIVFRILIARMTGRRAVPDAVNTVRAEAASQERQPSWLDHVLHRVLRKQ
jgi:nitroimidazol reductase NimA-like FMN-containing flavoprotein (pyridoxamine 5'-phosphate oxidase superfamily)